ncbi:MAG: right-handed parallel beta-helix repeat-containing protein, partial [Bacteroidota bacterium]
QITKTVGSGGDYPTLKLAFDAINAGTLTGDITLFIISDIADDNTATLEASYALASYTRILIQPSGSPPSGHWTLTANINAAMIALNGASNVTLDGQIGGSTWESNLYFVNNGAGSPTSGKAVRFEYGANHNLISFVHFESNCQLDVSAIFFGLPAGAGVGNSNNVIDHCDITKTHLGDLLTAISSENYPDNMRNTISYCNIYDWSFHGINLPSPCGRGWNIDGNSFYQTTPFLSEAENYAIRVINGDSISMQWNRIGGTDPNCGGANWVNTNTSNSTYGIYVEGDPSMTAYLGGNTVKNMETQGTRFSGIEIKGINTSAWGNQIGGWGEGGSGIAMTGIGKIYGIFATATSTLTHFDISYNNVRNITATNLSDGEALCGIYVFSPPSGNTVVVSDNSIGNLVSHGNSSGPLVRGIVTSCNAADVAIERNQVSDLISNNGGSFATQVQGIVVSGDLGQAMVTKNKIYNLTDNCTGSPSIHGMVFYNRNSQIHAVNNMISIDNGSNQNTVTIYGFYDPGTYGSGTESHLYYYNSAFIGGVSTGSGLTSCYKRDVNLRSTLINNVFYNERMSGVMQNYAMTVNSNESADFYSDHNDLYTSYENIVGSVNGGTAPLTFALWQSAFSPPHDMASYSVFPNFLSATDLHIDMNSTLNNTGLPIADVTDDIDGNPRDPLHPDPGINEFTYNNYTVGEGGTYPTIAAAFDAINSGAITNNIYLEVISNIEDTTQAVLNASWTGSANYSSVVIRPGGVMPAPPYDYRLISAFRRNGPMIKLDGADLVTFDGYMPGDLTTKRLIFQNRDAADSLGWVFSLTGGASSNTIKNCMIMANCKGYEGAVHFGESDGDPYGNSYNTIENCDISNAHYWTMYNGVLNNGITCDTNEHYNSYNIINNCDIHDCSGSAILIGRPAAPGLGWDDWGNDAWTIYGNHIYYTDDPDYYRPSYFNPYFRSLNGICIAKGNSHFISSNHIGGPGAFPFSTAIKIFGTQNASSGQPVTIYGNVISQISNLQYGIYVENQDANIEYDTIGSHSLANNIITGGQVYGVYVLNHQNNNVVHIKNNLIANIRTEAVWGPGVMMAGIGTNPNGNSLGPGCEISNNQIYNLRLVSGPQCPFPPYGPSTPSVIGIQVCGENPTVNGNKIGNLSIIGDDNTGAVDSVAGLYIKATGTCNLFNNMISIDHPSNIYSYRSHYFMAGILDVTPYGNVDNYYFNSVNLAQITSVYNLLSTFCFYRKGYATTNLRNNILCNRIHLTDPALPTGNCAIGVEQSPYLTTNFNDLYSYDPNRLGSSAFGEMYDLTGWQNAFLYPQDLNSVSILPTFASSTDLHCTGPADLDDRGVCVTGFPTDIDGNSRLNPPDIGANEFTAKSYKYWLGGDTPFWDTPLNWSPASVPTSTDNVMISPGVTYSPVIRISGAECNDLYIQPGCTITVQPGKTFTVNGKAVLIKTCE